MGAGSGNRRRKIVERVRWNDELGQPQLLLCARHEFFLLDIGADRDVEVTLAERFLEPSFLADEQQLVRLLAPVIAQSGCVTDKLTDTYLLTLVKSHEGPLGGNIRIETIVTR